MLWTVFQVLGLFFPFTFFFTFLQGFPGGSDYKESACNAGDLGLISGSGRSPGGGHGNTPVFLPRKSHGQRSLVGYNPWSHKESDMTETTKHAYMHGL